MRLPLAATAGILCTSAAFAELSREILLAGKAVRFRAGGASMQPLLRDGDLVLVRPADPHTVRVGDLVLFGAEPGRVLVHRVIRRSAGRHGVRFLVQGDRVARPDGEIPGGRVYGRVAAIERSGAHIDMARPVMRCLGWLAALHSRWDLGRSRRFRPARRLAKRLPVLSRYLA